MSDGVRPGRVEMQVRVCAVGALLELAALLPRVRVASTGDGLAVGGVPQARFAG